VAPARVEKARGHWRAPHRGQDPPARAVAVRAGWRCGGKPGQVLAQHRLAPAARAERRQRACPRRRPAHRARPARH